MFCRVFSFVLAVSLLAIPAVAGDTVSYDRQIRLLLSARCFPCHGPDAGMRKADMRKADMRMDIAEYGQTVIVPGKPDESEVMYRVMTTNPDDRMPPPEKDEALTPDEVALLTAWITQGAQRTTHWAFSKPVRPELPAVSNPDWVRNPIDTFVLARLDTEGLAPSPEADRVTLLRRLSLDLTGLPPTLEEIDRVASDTAPDWYTALVDRLLASPHYGEHWARHWLDAAQYADSDGFEKDAPRKMWAWRDWVIRAFNNNTPYGEFVIEQIAGDLLPDATQDNRVATGFLRNSMINQEGGIDPEQFRMEALFNRMDLVGRGILGLTVACAQCHSHKYDPLTHTEYYQMMAFLNNATEGSIPVYTPQEQDQRAVLLSLIAALENEIKAENTTWPEQLAAWEKSVRQDPDPAWEVLPLEFDDSSLDGQKFLPQPDGSYLTQGYSPGRTSPKITTHSGLQRITAIRLELLADPNLPAGGPGRSKVGACGISEVELQVTADNLEIKDFDQWQAVKIASAVADVDAPQRLIGPEFPLKVTEVRTRYLGGVHLAIDGDPDTAWTTDIDPGRRNQSRYAILTLAEPLVLAPGMTLAFRLQQRHGGWNNNDGQTNNIGRFRLSVTGAEAVPTRAVPAEIKSIIAKAPEARSTHEQDALFSYWISTVPEFYEINARIDGLWKAHPVGTTQLVLQAADQPRETHRLARGDFLSPEEAVAPATPAFLHPMTPGAGRDRTAFAQWLVSPESPTTARAYVNRVWQRYFGEGIAATTADLGMQGDPPSHPELLDWLAVQFMDSGWRIKDLHRLIVTSATYRQQSAVTPALQERDPYNRLLARGARFRVEGETVRDVTLAASGLLTEKVGGPSVYPPAPEFLFLPPLSYGTKTWNYDQGADKYRRALYTFRFRSVPFPALQVFDSPSGEAPCTRRERSNSPLQALTTLNESLFFESAVKLAEIALEKGGDTDRDRVEYAFRRCITRGPAPEEVDTVLAFLDLQRARLAVGELDPAAILDVTDSAWEADPNTLAAWALAARVILNLDETIVRQ